eukprot:9945381-Prorocentrum_lima.AAC.1
MTSSLVGSEMCIRDSWRIADRSIAACAAPYSEPQKTRRRKKMKEFLPTTSSAISTLKCWN